MPPELCTDTPCPSLWSSLGPPENLLGDPLADLGVSGGWRAAAAQGPLAPVTINESIVDMDLSKQNVKRCVKSPAPGAVG